MHWLNYLSISILHCGAFVDYICHKNVKITNHGLNHSGFVLSRSFPWVSLIATCTYMHHWFPHKLYLKVQRNESLTYTRYMLQFNSCIVSCEVRTKIDLHSIWSYPQCIQAIRTYFISITRVLIVELDFKLILSSSDCRL